MANSVRRAASALLTTIDTPCPFLVVEEVGEAVSEVGWMEDALSV